ncbi:DUF397 domain-containing protein [Micromonospora krabiensis]|uniref:DUF397 domain-containing protein n=1 Tax=Micromonospora krabiensis TaxID=307121 RepID=A0A1C3NEG1_9ACTN|nr:DUF397 domain-containing protein [Micromonospora krabiensis]SBV30928.1 protein of unknown function [Micromonospora krabiensis]
MTTALRPLNQWFKSTRSGPNCDNCVEMQFIGDGQVQVRGSKNPTGPVLTFTSGVWDAVNGGAAEGEFTTLPANAR